MARRIQRQPIAAAALFFAAALASRPADPQLSAEMRAVMDHVSADSLRAHVSYLASDELEGRGTPSRGLDLASEYIAGQFRRAGLEPAAGGSYFQAAPLRLREPDYSGFEMTFTAGGRSLKISPAEAYLAPDAALKLDQAPVVIAGGNTQLAPEEIDGKVLLVTSQRVPRGFEQSRPALVLTTAAQLPSAPQVAIADLGSRAGPPVGVLAKPELAGFLAGAGEVRLTARIAPAKETPATARNVAGLLRGSDPELRNTYVLLTSHYDHLGLAASGEDRIFNGANDDASGTASVLEVAGALGALPVHPRRSVLFVLFFGEERGLMGSRYYGRHPLAPPAQTVADLNLEHMGRTDASDGPQLRTASVTGFDFSGLPQILVEAGQLSGIRVYKNPQASDAFFTRSDNQTFAGLGIPAHTLCVAFEFPDYHKVSDHWQKLDYDNMAAVDRAVALGLLHLASDAAPPKWNESYGPARRYAEAARKLKP